MFGKNDILMRICDLERESAIQEERIYILEKEFKKICETKKSTKKTAKKGK